MRDTSPTDRLPTARFPAPPRRVSRRPASALLQLLLLVAAAGGCARPIPTPEGAANPTEADSAEVVRLPAYVFISVENRNSSDVIVWVEEASGRVTRLGMATASRGTTLRIPGSYIAASARLYLRARAVGGRQTVRSEGFTVQPGQQVVWTLESSLRRSMVSVY